MEEFFGFISNKYITTFERFSSVHLLFIIGVLSLSIIFGIIFRKKEVKTISYLMLTSGIILLILEVFIQLFNYYLDPISYKFETFPFNTNNLPMYLFILMPIFMKNKKIYNSLVSVVITYCAIYYFFTIIFPKDLTTLELFTLVVNSINSVLIIFNVFILGLNQKIEYRFLDFFRGLIVFVIVLVIARSINEYLYRFHNITTNLFYIGPNAKLDVIEDYLHVTNEYYKILIYLGVYIVIGFILHLFFYIKPFTKILGGIIQRAKLQEEYDETPEAYVGDIDLS